MSFLKEVLITCAHCKHEYVVKEPRLIKKKEWEHTHLSHSKLEEEVNGIYKHTISEVVITCCDECKNFNHTFKLNKKKITTSTNPPSSNDINKSLLSVWIDRFFKKRV